MEALSEEFYEWEERDESSISLFKHCVAGKYHEGSQVRNSDKNECQMC